MCSDKIVWYSEMSLTEDIEGKQRKVPKHAPHKKYTERGFPSVSQKEMCYLTQLKYGILYCKMLRLGKFMQH